MFSRTHLFPLVVALAITLATGTASSAADCIDWRSVTTVSPLVSWNGPEFHDFNGGSVNDGFLVKNGFDAAYNNYYYIYDVRDPLQPTLVYETHFDPSSGGSGWLSAVEDSLFCFRWGFMGGAGVHLCLATDPLVAHRAPLGGDVAIVGNHMFQTAWFYDSSVGIGFYDISDLGDIVQLGFYSSALYWNLAPFALSDDVALFMNAAQRLQVIDFQTPSSPVLRSGIDVCNCTNRRWLGRDGDRVYYSDANNTYAIDVSDLDNLQIEFVLPVTTWHMAIKGDLAVLDRQVYRLRGPGSPVAVSTVFGTPGTSEVAWAGDVLYRGAGAAYDMRDPAQPILLNETTGSLFSGNDVQGDCLVTGDGIFPLQCAFYVSDVGEVAMSHAGVTATPNPFNPRTEFALSFARPGPAEFSIYDMQGRVVRRLFRETVAAGTTSVVWDGRDDHGRRLPSGVYSARLDSAAGTREIRVSLIK